MKYLSGKEKIKANTYFSECSREALKSTCLRSKCGSVIVKDNEIIGKGYNSPPANLEIQRRCICDKSSLHKKIVDKTCCIHAEQRAIINALINNPEKILGSQLYFIRLNKDEKQSYSGSPYCTLCSKMALDVGIKKFALWHKEGIAEYDTGEYNLLSFQFQ